ncbi:iron hydrogenase [Myriangium duriaei CBS 260.36]|uniref:Cytosolic Fe-S cluster assembly factor NAR1 n=1 Tax=Myriangium duriaei CBS 260.36 TaxID=1168546 RepID=A0A9P4MQZ0_9PEZI|nr:iron hydrogenase [Myriangium duriaei CBS 260.36]
MSAILSADDLNDFISPSVACIKPVETLPSSEAPKHPENPYEVTTEDAAAVANAPPAQISLTDCLACSGCVTSAEAVLISLQSYQEVLTTLDAYPELPLPQTRQEAGNEAKWQNLAQVDGRIFVASVSPQARASIAATYGVSERAAGNMIQQLLSGEQGLRSGGKHGSGFAWVLDTNALREIALVAAVDEVDAVAFGRESTGDFTRRFHTPKKPVLTSACPGWICYAEKTHPHILPHISKLKSPQALAGTLIKTVLSRRFGVSPDKIWHMAVMPCFDKKLEASREEFTDAYWSENVSSTDSSVAKSTGTRGIRDVDLVITSRELLSLAEARDISFPQLSRRPVPQHRRTSFPDSRLGSFLFPCASRRNVSSDSGSSGGYLWHIVQTIHSRHPGSRVTVQRGRNSDVVEYAVMSSDNTSLFRAARYYGFRNIQNLVRRLRPARASRMPGVARRPGQASAIAGDSYDYVEVMACPGGCTNGGGQIKAEDAAVLQTRDAAATVPAQSKDKTAQREWLARVDEAYFSASSENEDDQAEDEERSTQHQEITDGDIVDGVAHNHVKSLIAHWADVTALTRESLLRTTYRKVESDVGKKASEVERVAGLASTVGGGW